MIKCAMLYILDAYNVIHKVPELEACLNRGLRQARDALVMFCQHLLAKRRDIHQIIIVFDGRTEFHHLPREQTPKIRIEYSDTEEKADERIVKILEEHEAVAGKAVVSDDNFVRNQARAYRTRITSVAEFNAMLKKFPSSRQGKNGTGPGCKVPPSLESAITAAYKKDLGLA